MWEKKKYLVNKKPNRISVKPQSIYSKDQD